MALDPQRVIVTIGAAVLLSVVWWRRFRRPEYANEPAWIRLGDLAFVVLVVVAVAYMWTTTP